MKNKKNLLLTCDVYKMAHCRLDSPGLTKVYSYLCARSKKKSNDALFFGLQYYLKEYLEHGVSHEDVQEFFDLYSSILGSSVPEDMQKKFRDLADLGYLPIEIKAVPEGTIIDNQNVLMTMTNTLSEYSWLVGFLETNLLKIWSPISVATASLKYKRLVTKFTQETSDSDFLLPFLIHDFGARGVSSEESAAINGAGHLVNFCGTDTVQAVKLLKDYYHGEGLIGASVCASEHSKHQPFGPSAQGELDYVELMLNAAPSGIVSVVSDAYDYWRMLTVTLPAVKDKILARDGKYVVRPDSGDPKRILCGTAEVYPYLDYAEEMLASEVRIDKKSPVFQLETNLKYYQCQLENGIFETVEVEATPEQKGTFRILDELFGSTINSKGYKELNPKIGVIYGDGMFYERYEDILKTMKEMGYANTNLVVGIGGLLLQQHNRDDLGFAFKATYAEINGEGCELFKDPITDPGKKSHKGLMYLSQDFHGRYVTVDQCSQEDEKIGLLRTVFLNGKLVNETNLQQIRERAKV
jgi:nicotinamide phosphoribosyltransferase